MKLFDNTEIAFASKSDAALERAYFLFRLIAIQPLVKIGTHIAQFALKSHLPVEGLIRASVFDHFCMCVYVCMYKNCIFLSFLGRMGNQK